MYFYLSFFVITFDCFLHGATLSFCLENKYSRKISLPVFAFASFCCLAFKFSVYDNSNLLSLSSILAQLILYLYALFAFKNRLVQKLVLCIALISTACFKEVIAVFFLKYIFKCPDSVRLSPSSYEFFLSSAIAMNLGSIFFLLIIFFWKSVTRHKMPKLLPYMPVFVSLFFTFSALISISHMPKHRNSFPLLDFSIVFAVFVNILLFFLILGVQKKSKKEKAYQALCERYELETLQYEALKARSDELAKLRHDFNGHLATINSLLYSKNYAAANEFATALKKELSRFNDSSL